MKRSDFRKLTESRIVLLDGATGSNFLLAGMPSGCCAEMWILEHPEELRKLHGAYVNAGTQIIFAPTFGGNKTMLAEKKVALSVEEINKRIVALTKEAVGGRALIAGDLTMTGKGMRPTGELSVLEAIKIYEEQAKALYEAGVDLFIVETMVSLQEMRAALMAIKKVCDLPVMATFTVDKNGSTFLGTDIAAAGVTLEKMGVDAVGMNCSMGPDQMAGPLKKLKAAVSIPVIAKANAGHPERENGRTVYKMDPDTYKESAKGLLAAGVDLIGGCCGTTPATIEKVCELLKEEKRYVPLEEKTAGAQEECQKRETTGAQDICPGQKILLTTQKHIFAPEDFSVDTYTANASENDEFRECLELKEFEDLMDILDEAGEGSLLVIHVDEVSLAPEDYMEELMGAIAGLDRPVCIDTKRQDVLKEALQDYCGIAAVKKNAFCETKEAKDLIATFGAVVMASC